MQQLFMLDDIKITFSSLKYQSLTNILFLAACFSYTGPSSGNTFLWNVLHSARMSVVLVDVRRRRSRF
jgi:hypothetical protein